MVLAAHGFARDVGLGGDVVEGHDDVEHGRPDVWLLVEAHGGDHDQLVEGPDRVAPVQERIRQLGVPPLVLDEGTRLHAFSSNTYRKLRTHMSVQELEGIDNGECIRKK